jgi:hypothetical protein
LNFLPTWRKLVGPRMMLFRLILNNSMFGKTFINVAHMVLEILGNLVSFYFQTRLYIYHPAVPKTNEGQRKITEDLTTTKTQRNLRYQLNASEVHSGGKLITGCLKHSNAVWPNCSGDILAV